MAPPDGVAAGTDKANSKLTTMEHLIQLKEVCVNCFITPLTFWYYPVTDFAHDNPANTGRVITVPGTVFEHGF